jgi:hypothetical protein
MPVLRPPIDCEPDYQGPIIFLAGPIQGSDPWQEEAIRLIAPRLPEALIASPRRLDFDGKLSAAEYAEQVEWESRYLRQAAVTGCVLFWLAAEAEHDCERAYAQTTRFELAEWVVRHEHEAARVAVGVEEGFPGARYIRYRLESIPGITVRDSLPETCFDTVAHAVAASERAAERRGSASLSD